MIEVQGLTKRYDGRQALADLTFTAPRGQVLGLVGPAGAGKSTVVRILAGAAHPDSGTVTVDGLDPRSREARRRFGYLPQTAPLSLEMRVQSHLDLLCRLHGVPAGVRRARVDHALSACGLQEVRRQVAGGLSTTMRRRLALALAVVHDPDLLVLDEPAAGLDPEQTGEMRELVARVGRGRTVVLASRALAGVGAVCDRLLVLKQGRLAADETPAGLASRLGGRATEDVVALVRGDVASVERHLGRLAGVTRVTAEDLGDGAHRIVVSGGGDGLQDAVARAIIRRGLRLQELSSRRVDLDDALDGILEEAS